MKYRDNNKDAIKKMIKEKGECPVFVRGTCTEEAVWLLGYGDKYKSFPEKIYAFPVYEGFGKAEIKPKKPVPENYTLERMRNEVLLASDVMGGIGPSLFRYGNDEKEEEFLLDDNRNGSVIYFSPKIISLGYEQDNTVVDRPDELCAVEIRISNDFYPDNISFVEPLGKTDYNILKKEINKGSKKIMKPRFNNREMLVDYLCENLDNITFARNGFTFPE